MKRRICFIINPISGVGKQKIVEPLIQALFLPNQYECVIRYTEYSGHATELARQAVAEEVDTIVAVGGDGSVHEVAAGMLQSKAQLGILPCGSGNGFARHFQLPLDLKKAILTIQDGKKISVDALSINETCCINIAGLGFDAHVAHAFAHAGKRGLMTYLKIILKSYFSYKEQAYELEIDGKKIRANAFLLSIANASQYGNNAFISPNSNATDGRFEICLLKKLPWYLLPIYAWRLMNKGLKNSAYYSYYSADEALVQAQSKEIHIDGEAIVMNSPIRIKSLPCALNLIVPTSYEK